MRTNCLDEYVFELEYDNGYEWQVLAFAEEKVEITEESTEYAPDTILSESYPVGMSEITVKGIKKGNATVILAHLQKGLDVESATNIIIASFYVDENCDVTLVSEDDGMFLLN